MEASIVLRDWKFDNLSIKSTWWSDWQDMISKIWWRQRSSLWKRVWQLNYKTDLMIWSTRSVWWWFDLWDHNQFNKQYNECQCMKEAQKDWCFDQEKCFKLISTDEISSSWWEAVKDHKRSYHWIRERDCWSCSSDLWHNIFVSYSGRNSGISI